ncbi:hypothetical protein ACMFMG_010257 [Clarireedia jacksonii]
MRGILRGMIQCQVFRTRHSSRYLRFVPHYHSTFSSIATSRNIENELPTSQPVVEPGSEQNGIDTSASSTGTEGGVGQNQSVPSYRNRHLPISPLMDPEFHAARTKHHSPKPLPSGPPSEFSKQLANNIFAQALATPVRQCSVNLISLPSFFLQDFELVAHPTTGEPYHIPRSLASKHKSPSSQSLNEKNQPSQNSLPRRTPTIGSRNFVTLRRALFQSFLIKKSGYDQIYRKFGRGGQTTKERMATVNRAIWRLDMDTFILSRMRDNIGSALLHLAQLNKGYVVPCADWQDATSKQQSGAVLWLGRNAQIEEGKSIAEEGEEQEVPPGEFDILNLNGKTLPVYNLRGLLGKEWVEKLRDRNHPFDTFGAKLVVIKKKNVTKDTLMGLWRLQGYVATYGEEMREEKPEKGASPKIDSNTIFRSIMREK